MPHDGSSRSRRRVLVALAGLLVVVGGAAAFWWRSSASSGVASREDTEFVEPEVLSPGYVGSQACAACHAERVAEFRQTNHFRACRVPRADEMPAGFAAGKGTHATRDPALRFEMTRAGDDFLHTAIHTTPKGEDRKSSRIDLVYGAGALDEVFFSWRGDRLYELPIVWLHPLKRWGNSSHYRYGTGDFSRDATPRCLECHNTWMRHVAGTPNEYKRDDLILGVTCERCHGPGREHVAFHEAHPEAESGHAVVHPGRLPRERRLEICTQCHGNSTKPRGAAFGYRPGEPLEAFFRTAVSKHPENDHVANQVKYLRQSKCFQKSDTLTCTTCHDPHRPHGPTDTAAVRQACQECHKPADCRERDRLPAAVRDNCVGCHMPPRVWMNVHFHTEDDEYVPPIRRSLHRIAVYPEARQEVLLAWHRKQADAASKQEAARLTAALVEHWLAEAETYRRDYRFLAAIGAVREALSFDPAPAVRAKLKEAVAVQGKLDADLVEALHQFDERRFPEATETFNAILATKPDMALAHGKLGTLYALAGRRDLAVRHLREVARHDPDDSYGLMMLGWMAYLEGRAADAVEDYRRADEIEPRNAKTHYHWGLALAQLGRWEEASEHFRQVLAIDPKHAGGSQGLGHALRQQGKTAEALRYARHAARLTDFRNPDILLTLADVYADAGRPADAEETAAKALDAAQASDPKLVPQIRERVEEIRARAKKPPK